VADTAICENEPVPTAPDEIALVVDMESGETTAMQPATLAALGLKERSDLQRLITAHPEVVGRDLLLITTEFDQWELKDQKVPDRLDVLFLDSSGAPLVAELKRDKAADTTELQALKYAAYCSQLTVEDVIDAHGKQHGLPLEDARQAVVDHAPSLADGELGQIRIRLIAGQFGPAVTSVVLWLRDHDIDIGCIEVTARLFDDGHAVLSSRQFIPLPEAEDYLVRRRRKEQEEEQTKRKRRKLNSVPLLDEAGVVKAGDPIKLKINQFSEAWRPKVEALVAQDSRVRR
jgi:hypothetical protein